MNPSKVSIPTALSGSSTENNTRATFVSVKTCRLGSSLERREEDVVRTPLKAVLGNTERPRGLPELTSGLRGYCALYQPRKLVEAVEGYPGSSPYIGNHLIGFLPDFRKSDLDRP